MQSERIIQVPAISMGTQYPLHPVCMVPDGVTKRGCNVSVSVSLGQRRVQLAPLLPDALRAERIGAFSSSG